jgi:hypothetical protein
MSNKRAVAVKTGFVIPFSPTPCRIALIGLLGLLMVLMAAVPGVMAQATDLPAGVVEQESGYYYTVQKGDTLWGLSRRFADSPFYWPGLWQKNPQIPNPHRIFPGDRIRLYRKTWTEPLAIEPQPTTGASAAYHEPPYYRYPGMLRVGFIRREPIPPSATIFKLDPEKTVSGQFDAVMIHPATGTALVAGQRYTVYRTLDPFFDADGKTFVGYQHLILGIAEITEVGKDLATAAVVKSFHEMQVGDKLMPFEKRSEKIPLAPSTPAIKGKILAAEEERSMLGDHDLVFIDRGQRDGIRNGQQYVIYDAAERHVDPQSGVQASLPPVEQGTLLVLRTENETATAIITASKKNIAPGARFKTPNSP